MGFMGFCRASGGGCGPSCFCLLFVIAGFMGVCSTSRGGYDLVLPASREYCITADKRGSATVRQGRSYRT